MKKKELDDYDRLELSEYTPEERANQFKEGIIEMAKQGIISPEDAKHWLENIDKWLLTELEN